MKRKLILKLVAVGGMMLALFALLASVAKPGVVSATANPLPPLLSCPNLDGSTEVPTMPPDPTKLGKVSAVDILVVAQHYGKSYGQPGYSSLYDSVSPFNSTSPSYPSGTGRIGSVDLLYVAQKYGHFCPLVDTQIARATRAISEPMYSDILCDPSLLVAVNCGGDPRFLIEDPAFLASKGYYTSSVDVPGQGVHYVNFSLWDGVFNPVRPEGLVYKVIGPEDPGPFSGSCTDGVDNSAADTIHGGDGLADGADPDCHVSRLVAQLYYAEGDVVSWGPDRDHNVRAVNTDSFCTAGCSWAGVNDGWHWHENLCTVGIGTAQATITRLPNEHDCGKYGLTLGITCTFPLNCRWTAAVGWMSHLWNWLPNANYTNAVNPNANGQCTVAYCATGEANGRFADCYPQATGSPPPNDYWNAYNCPQ